MQGTKEKPIQLLNHSNHYFYPENEGGLEALVLFPDGKTRRKGRPGSSVWVFDGENSRYRSHILSNDVGCGMAVFALNSIDPRKSADMIAEYLKKEKSLGRGNHFVDICTGLEGQGNIMIIHSDGKMSKKTPSDFKEAYERTEAARRFREKLGQSLAKLIGSNYEVVLNHSHNTIEKIDDKVIYRKGAVKVNPNKVHMLPSHLGATILFYTVDKDNMPLYSSMPHGSGRKGPMRDFKSTIEDVQELRKTVYVPEIISDASLKSEHPMAYNGPEVIFEKLGEYIVSLGDVKILSYIGKV